MKNPPFVPKGSFFAMLLMTAFIAGCGKNNFDASVPPANSIPAKNLTSAAIAPLPQIQLKRVFPDLQITPSPSMDDDQMQRPLWMCQPPDGSGRFFIVEQSGKILIVKKGSDGSKAKEFLNIEDRHPYFQNEDGLLSIAFHPGFKTNGLFYIYYTQENSPEQRARMQNFPYRSVISEMKVSATDPDKADTNSERVLFEVPEPFWNHKGGELCFGPDGCLYLGLGDGGPPSGGDPFNNGQNLSTLLAKMLRIDVNSRTANLPYGIPRDNPFANATNARPEIFAYGLRNPWRYSFDRKTGDLWVGDVGQDLWEEIDIVTNGGNYGWSEREGSHGFKDQSQDGRIRYADPIMEYTHRPSLQSEGMFPDHSIGTCVTGGYVYRGKQFPSLDGIYIYGDYTLGTIWGLRYDRNTKKVTAHGTLLSQGENICSFAEDDDGELYVLTQDGGIYQITAE